MLSLPVSPSSEFSEGEIINESGRKRECRQHESGACIRMYTLTRFNFMRWS